MTYVAIAYTMWGKGKTIEEAMKNCAKAGNISVAKLKKQAHVVYETSDDGAYVNEYGGLCRMREASCTEVVRFPKEERKMK